MTDLPLATAVPGSWALPGPAAGCEGHGKAAAPFVFPSRARPVGQGSPRHRAACWAEPGARCPTPPAAAICHRLSAWLPCQQHGSPAQGEPLGFPLPPVTPSGSCWQRHPGSAPTHRGLCLQLLSWAACKPHAGGFVRGPEPGLLPARLPLNPRGVTRSIPKDFRSASDVPSPAAASVPGRSLGYALQGFLQASVKPSIPDF